MLLALLALLPSAPQEQWDDWDEWTRLLAPVEVEWPAPLDSVVWREDLDSALEEAAESNRPLFVTLRCLPCKQCSEFDKDVLEGGPELDPLLRQFVTVRLTSMRDVEWNVLPYDLYQDLDLSWWGYVLAPSRGIYAIYGGRDEISDTTRISVPSLANVLRRVLDHHYGRKGWTNGIYSGPPASPTLEPGWESWAARGAKEVAPDQCLHCHQVAEILRQPDIDSGSFDKHEDFYVWPFPENVGIHIDRDDGLLVNEVDPESPAARAGIRPGDELRVADGVLLFGQTDFRGVLHRVAGPSKRDAPGRGRSSIPFALVRDGKILPGRLDLPAGWRRTDLGWRKSVAESAAGAAPGFPWPLAAEAKTRELRGLAAGTMAVRPYYPKGAQGLAAEAGLRRDDVIVAVDGESPDLAGRPFLVWFRLGHEPGDRVELTVVDASGARRTLDYVLR